MFARFIRACGGNVLPTFAVAAVPLIVATGGVIDYGRAYDQKTIAQDAMDSAALAAGKKIGLITNAAVMTEADNLFAVNVGTKLDKTPALTGTIAASTLTLNTTLHVPTYFLGMIGLNEFVFPLVSKTTLAMGTLEIVMALDNSGSMSGSKISTLKTAASSLATTLWGLGATSTKTDPVKIGIVPFAAAVNVGANYATDSSATWLDKTGASSMSGAALEDFGATNVSNLSMFSNFNNTSWGGCVEERPEPYDVTDDAPSASTPDTLFEPMFAPDEPDNLTSTSSCTSGSQKLGSYSSLRYNCALGGSQSYNNYLPDIAAPKVCGNTVTISLAYTAVFTTGTAHHLAVGDTVVFNTTGSLPSTITPGSTYYVKTVPSSTTFTISSTSGGTAISTSGKSQSGTQTMTSSALWTCSNGSASCAGTSNGQADESNFAKVCKYGSSASKVTPASITVGGIAGGPNFMCTTPALTPLSTSSTTVTNAINGLVSTGATNILAGVTWGWRLLSPGAPFSEGRSYSDNANQKILILMTDGENTYYPNNSFLKSWYAAFGYVEEGRLGTTSTTQSTLTGKMNDRTLTACTNAKAAGIRIYTVGFEINSATSSDPETALALLQNCASDSSKYFDAQNESALVSAFSAIGNDISLLRIAE